MATPRVSRVGPPAEGLSRRSVGRGSTVVWSPSKGGGCANRAYPIWVCVRSPMTEVRGSTFENGCSASGIPEYRRYRPAGIKDRPSDLGDRRSHAYPNR
eukprot:4975509-Prymnesium_polylepis.1